MIASLAPWTGLSHVLSHPFMVRALVTGGLVALACGLVGYFLVLRAQVFAADALSHVAFTGAAAALALGVDLRFGLFGACVGVAVFLALIGRRGRPDDVVTGNMFAWVLGLGTLLLSIYTRSSSNGQTGVNVLFGSVFGLDPAPARFAAWVALGLCAVVIGLARPLLFATLDEAAAAAAGVPVRTLGVAFLAVVGAAAGEATQVVGALLLLGLLSAPTAAAYRLTTNPWRGLALSGALAVGSMWTGLILAYELPVLPPSFAVVAAATATYVAALLGCYFRRKAPAGPPPSIARPEALGVSE